MKINVNSLCITVTSIQFIVPMKWDSIVNDKVKISAEEICEGNETFSTASTMSKPYILLIFITLKQSSNRKLKNNFCEEASFRMDDNSLLNRRVGSLEIHSFKIIVFAIFESYGISLYCLHLYSMQYFKQNIFLSLGIELIDLFSQLCRHGRMQSLTLRLCY